MAKIDSIEALRDHAIDTLQKLANQQIDAQEAAVTGKLCDSVISTIKTQLEYARMLSEEPKIAFMGDSHGHSGKLLEGSKSTKTLESPKLR